MGHDTVPEHDAVDDIVSQWARQWPDLDVTPLEVLGRLHRTYLRYQSAIGRVFDEFGINMASFDVLAALRRAGEPYRMTSGQLAESSLVTTGGITLRIDRLVQAGLVRRERDEEDRRIVHAQLTDEGKKLIDEIAVAHFENEARMLAGLSAADQAALAGLLRKLEHSIIRHDGE
ncbi:MarR family transcriptional regulator [Rhodococcus sp. CX]|uniref:MarR family winged helix-turn-helix transcriptional regulator n=1 Tax=Rhodococcus sp. CX TaxID=2789880 RepID=UPI0018CF5D0F|nr:MarR family transcriptional regulator [Rhodococcus sp. CX]MBH0121840.1 MarR family transcriptional regulator [Rhodococcus sp. CX]